MSREETTEPRSDDREAIDWPLLATEDAFRRCRRVFLGLVLALASYRLTIGGISIDLVPDWVGWWIVAAALGGLRPIHPRVPRLVRFAWASCALAAAKWITIPRLASEPLLQIGGTLLGIAATLLLILFVWDFCALVARAASDTQDERLRERTDLCRQVVTIALIVSWLLPIPIHFGETLHPATAIAVVVLGLFAHVFFAVIVWAFGTLIGRVIEAMTARESSA